MLGITSGSPYGCRLKTSLMQSNAEMHVSKVPYVVNQNMLCAGIADIRICLTPLLMLTKLNTD